LEFDIQQSFKEAQNYMRNKIRCLLIISLTLFSIDSLAADLSLKEFLRNVAEKNLSLKAEEAKLEVSQAKSVGLNIPPPMVAVSQMRDARGSANNFEVSQTIPFPSKLTNDHSARKFEAKAQEAIFSASKVEVLAKARLMYISAWLTQERVQLLQERKSIIQQHLKLSTASARSDSFLKIHVLKAESDSDLLENEIVETEQLTRERQISLAEFSNEDPMTFKPKLLEPELSAVPSLGDISEPLQLEVKRLSLETLKARESEAKASWLPDISLRYREMGGGTVQMEKFNEVMVGVTLPFVYFWEPHAASKSATAERYQGEAEFSKERLKISSRTATLLAKTESLKKEIIQINEKLLPRAEKRMRLIRNIAPRDMESLQDHRESMEAFPLLKLKSLDLREQYEEAIAELSSFSKGVNP
jgi:outer membrane protein, heavy metal efflux system